MIQELNIPEIENVDGAALSTNQTIGYTLIGIAAVATGTFPLVLAGTFLLGMTGILATN